MDFSRVVRRFATPLPVAVYDVRGGYEAGEWRWLKETLRCEALQAVVLQMTVEELRLYPQGNITGGGIALLTAEPMHISGTLRDGGEDDIQSYVVYQGIKWRVVGDGFLSGPGNAGNTGTHCFHCLRWFD